MNLDKILFGDNQFFGINHMSEDKARTQAMKFNTSESIMNVLDMAYSAGIHTFMCTTHSQLDPIVETIKTNPHKYKDFKFYPGMPYAHKYANAIGEVGILETLKRFSPSGVLGTLVKGSISAATQDAKKVMEMLVDAEMAGFTDVNTPIIFLQNVVTDLILGLGMHNMFGAFRDYVRTRYDAEAGFCTMNLPKLVEVLRNEGIENPVVCANVNKIGFRMCGGVDAYLETIKQGNARVIAMSVFASGAIPPKEAIDWACQVEGLDSIVFGASSQANIVNSKNLIESHWGAS